MDFYKQKWVMRFAPKDNTDFAMVIGSVCFYSTPKEHVPDSWRRHEECHKRQWEKWWYIGFLPAYFGNRLWNKLFNGMTWLESYYNSPFEIEARKCEDQ